MPRLAMLASFVLFLAACSGSGDAVDPATASGDEDVVAATAPPAATATPEPPPTATPEPPPTATPEPPPTATPEPAPLELIADGAYSVGTTTITLDAETDRPLTVSVWFPIADGITAEPARYSFITGDYYESPRAVETDASALEDGLFPLVVYSHGSGGVRFVHSDYTEVLASHGHIVAAPDHTGNTAVEQFLGIEDDPGTIALKRPADVISVIDALSDGDHPTAGDFAQSVDADKVAVTGHSFGGFTALAVVSGYANPLGETPPDERVDAIITLAPAVGPYEEPNLLNSERLGDVDVPALVMVGTDDKTTPVDPHVERVWSETASSPNYRLELVGAEHQSFTDVCNYVAAFEAGQEVTDPVREVIDGFAEFACAPDDMTIDRVQELTNTFAVQFLNSIFAEGEMVATASMATIDDAIYQVRAD